MNVIFRNTREILFLCLLILARFHASGQDSSAPKVISPFESLPLTDVVAKGNTATGTIEIEMKFQNKYPKVADVYLSLGPYNDFGITDDKGNKYKVFTNEGLIESSPINKGYKQVNAVQFGNKKMQMVTYLKDTLNNGQSLVFKFTIGKLDKSTTYIKEVHIRCILSLNHVWAGDQSYQIRNIMVDWAKPQK
jgi:hypothetical protein